MQNLLVVCADKDLRKDLSRVLGAELNFLYVDVDDVLDFELLNQKDITLSKANDVLKQLERKSIDRVLGFKNCIITMSRDLFISNDNLKLFKDIKKVFVSLSKSYFVARFKGDDKYKLEHELILFDKINKLISINCDIVVDKDIKSLEELKIEIMSKLNI
ncbi:MAG: hypothetical protein IJ458_01335 [Clostridia bacterium]|nr:hypothetical protein [Clostridia bacterium]